MSGKERLSANIAEAYRRSGKSTRQIERESGLSAKTMQRWINGTYVPNALTLKIFCDTVKTSIEEIYRGV